MLVKKAADYINSVNYINASFSVPCFFLEYGLGPTLQPGPRFCNSSENEPRLG